ncbi:hypothetical protein BDZ91DRAFT_317257 [Kalaharituber pfeilii]|nr:hypothetical protein BDZ91DRAFT_317257 [Kalaharituber pfeilii]
MERPWFHRQALCVYVRTNFYVVPCMKSTHSVSHLSERLRNGNVTLWQISLEGPQQPDTKRTCLLRKDLVPEHFVRSFDSIQGQQLKFAPKKHTYTHLDCTSGDFPFFLLLILLLFLPNVAFAQSFDRTLPLPPATALFPFPSLPPDSQIFSSRSFCRDTYNTCMAVFRDCLRVVGRIPGANLLCEQWRDGICKEGIREGCDRLPPDNASPAPSSITFETAPQVGESTTTIGNSSAQQSATQTSTEFLISKLPTSSTDIPSPRTESETSAIFTPTPTQTITVVTTALEPTTFTFITVITKQTTIITTQTITNSGNFAITTTWTMEVQVTERGLTFIVNDAGEGKKVGKVWLWCVLAVIGLTASI